MPNIKKRQPDLATSVVVKIGLSFLLMVSAISQVISRGVFEKTEVGMPKEKVHELVNCRKRTWRASVMLNSVPTNKIIASLDFMSMTDYYLKICKNQKTAV